MRLAIYEGSEQIELIELAGDVSDYDIVISSFEPVEMPQRLYEGDPPEVPEVDPDGIEADYNRQLYETMRNNPESLPGDIRRSIYQHQVITRGVLERWVEEQGYSTYTGGFRAALIVLENETGEIDRVGDGDDMRINWTGET